jgi:hypothetical protein
MKGEMRQPPLLILRKLNTQKMRAECFSRPRNMASQSVSYRFTHEAVVETVALVTVTKRCLGCA